MNVRSNETNTRARVLAYINQCRHSPSVREIGRAVGLKSSSSVFFHLRALERDGLIEYHGGPYSRRITKVVA